MSMGHSLSSSLTAEADRTVVLVRHAAPLIDPGIQPIEWQLSHDGRSSCGSLAAELRDFLPANLVTSPEPKAFQTAESIAGELGLDLSVREDLCEHRRPGAFLCTADFNSTIRAFFANPTEVVYGTESCDELGLRIHREVRTALTDQTSPNVVLVSHGTAMASFLRRRFQVDAYALWRSFALPAFLAYTIPRFDIVGSSGVDETLFAGTVTGA